LKLTDVHATVPSRDDCHAALTGSETYLAEDSLACQQFGAQANNETKHCQSTIPGLSEVAEAESGLS
jgi:hypothetical protein